MLRTPFYLPQPLPARGDSIPMRLDRWLARRGTLLREAFLARASDRLDLERRQSHLERFGLPDPL
jgi:hypothetical protein